MRLSPGALILSAAFLATSPTVQSGASHPVPASWHRLVTWLQTQTKTALSDAIGGRTLKEDQCLKEVEADLVCELLQSAYGDTKRENFILSYFAQREGARVAQVLKKDPEKQMQAESAYGMIAASIEALLDVNLIRTRQEREDELKALQLALIDYLGTQEDSGVADIKELGYDVLNDWHAFSSLILRDEDWKSELRAWFFYIAEQSGVKWVTSKDRDAFEDSLETMFSHRFCFDEQNARTFETAKRQLIRLSKKYGFTREQALGHFEKKFATKR